MISNNNCCFFSKEVRTIRRNEENEGAGYSSYKEEEDF